MVVDFLHPKPVPILVSLGDSGWSTTSVASQLEVHNGSLLQGYQNTPHRL